MKQFALILISFIPLFVFSQNDTLTYQKTFYGNGVVKNEGLITSNGVKHGLWIKRNKKGMKTSSGEYNYGIQEGLYTCYYLDGSILFTAEFKDGKRHGKFIDYNQDGTIKKVRVYENGKVISKKRLE